MQHNVHPCDDRLQGALVAAGDALPDDDNTCMEGVPNSGRGVTVEADSILAGTQNGWVDGVANSGVRRAAHLLVSTFSYLFAGVQC